jgi:hypothetical protein
MTLFGEAAEVGVGDIKRGDITSMENAFFFGEREDLVIWICAIHVIIAW